MILTPDVIKTEGGVDIKEYLLTKHNPNKIDLPTQPLTKVLGVTIHNVERLTPVDGTTPAEHYARMTVEGQLGTMRPHFYVDESCAWQLLPLKLAGWHATDDEGDGNSHTIAIECVMSKKNSDLDKKAEANAAKLTANLLTSFGLGIDGLFAHEDWLPDDFKSKHKCPKYILPHWDAFRNKVAAHMGIRLPKPPSSEVAFSVGDRVYVKKGAIDCNGASISAIYAGSNLPTVITKIEDTLCTVSRNGVDIFTLSAEYLSCSFESSSEKQLTAGCKVRVSPGAVWWDGLTPPKSVFNRFFYVQSLHVGSGKCTIGISPTERADTRVGSISRDFLEVI